MTEDRGPRKNIDMHLVNKFNTLKKILVKEAQGVEI